MGRGRPAPGSNRGDMRNLLPYLVSWGVLLLAVVVLYVYRRRVARADDETLHVLDSNADKVAQQVAVVKKLEVIDRWGKILTVLLVLYALVLFVMYAYAAWQESSGVPMG